MVWFKVDDSFESHPKVKSIPKRQRTRAVGLWTLAGSWSARQLTDGKIPAYMLEELAATEADAAVLVTANLWSTTDSGYVFNDWDDWQPTRAKVNEERDAAKERMRIARERKKSPGSGDVRANESATPPNVQDRSGEVRSTPRSVTPTRPDPTRPDLKKISGPATADREDVIRLCNRLAEHVEANGAKRPEITERWGDAARLLIDRDGYSERQIAWIIDWSQRDSFWMSNVLSMPKLREKFDQLVLKSKAPWTTTAGLRLAASGEPIFTVAPDDRR